MTLKSRTLIGAALLALAASTAFAALSATASSDPQKVERVKVKLVLDDDSAADRIELDDLGEMSLGETRSYTTDSGKSVLVTRDEEGWELDVDGKKLRVGDHAAGEGDVFVHRMKKFELGEDGEMKSMVFLSGDAAEDGDVRIVRSIGLNGESSNGGHAFAFDTDGHTMAFGNQALFERLKKNEKFLSLDPATRELVLEAIRESAPKLEWIGEDGAGEGHKMMVLELEKDSKETSDD